MIPTKYKSKLPQAQSYPLGAKAISEALAGAPHIEELSLRFYNLAVWPAMEFQRRIRDALPYPVLESQYEPQRKPGLSARNDWIESGQYQPHWSITVYPVLRELRHATGQLLLSEGLPIVREWLESSKMVGWDIRRHRIELVFNQAEPTLSIIREDGI